MSSNLPGPGWYVDPWQQAHWRWWDGTRWTPSVWPPPGPTVWQPARAGGLAGAHSAEQRARPWARVSIVAWGVIAATNCIGFVQLAPASQLWLHKVRDLQTGQPLPPFPTLPVLADLGSLMLILFSVPFLIWQAQSARVARLLGYPAQFSPGLGIGGWFIPIVNFWFPYRALRDLLSPANAMRTRVLVAWIAYLATGLLSIAVLAVSMFSTGWTALPIVLQLACAATAAGLGWRLMGAVERDHRMAAEALLGRPADALVGR